MQVYYTQGPVTGQAKRILKNSCAPRYEIKGMLRRRLRKDSGGKMYFSERHYQIRNTDVFNILYRVCILQENKKYTSRISNMMLLPKILRSTFIPRTVICTHFNVYT